MSKYSIIEIDMIVQLSQEVISDYNNYTFAMGNKKWVITQMFTIMFKNKFVCTFTEESVVLYSSAIT